MLEKAVYLGYPLAQYDLSRKYLSDAIQHADTGQKAKVERLKRYYWLRQSACNGCVPAMSDLSSLLVADDSTEQVAREGIDWMLRAARAGDVKSQYALSDRYFTGVDGDIGSDDILEVNEKEGLRWLREAARRLPEAKMTLANYYLGTESPQERKEGFNILLGFENDDKYSYHSSPALEMRIADCYFKGIGVETNEEEGLRWLREAATRPGATGGTNAVYRLACYYLDAASSTQQEKEEGFNLLSSVAYDDHPECQYKIGLCYLDGIGVEADEEEGYSWIKKATANGDRDAVDFAAGHGIEFEEGEEEDDEFEWEEDEE